MDTRIELEKIVSSTTVYRGKTLRHKVVRVKMSDGEMYLRDTVEHPGAVALIPVLQDEVILIRQSRVAVGKVLFEIPAGTLESEESPERCAARELVEETGYRAGSLVKLFRCFLAPGYSSEMIHFYLATELQPAGQHLDEDEEIQVCPTPVQKALEMVRSNDIEDAKTVIGLMLYEKYLELRKGC